MYVKDAQLFDIMCIAYNGVTIISDGPYVYGLLIHQSNIEKYNVSSISVLIESKLIGTWPEMSTCSRLHYRLTYSNANTSMKTPVYWSEFD